MFCEKILQIASASRFAGANRTPVYPPRTLADPRSASACAGADSPTVPHTAGRSTDRLRRVDASMVVLEYIKVLVWPLVVLAVIVVFRARIGALLARLTRIEALGARAEFEQAVAQSGANSPVSRTVRTQELAWVTPKSFLDVRTIGELLHEHGEVAVNVEALGDDEAKRVVDFMAGLAFYSRGYIERLSTRRFLIRAGD